MSARRNIGMARRLRREQTTAEARLWSVLRNRQLDGFKFRRQVPIDRFIVDVLCIDAKLVIEIDGGHHAARVEADADRTRTLEQLGFHVVRFWNHQVLDELESVVEAILAKLHAGQV